MSATGLDVFDKTLQTTNITSTRTRSRKCGRRCRRTSAPCGRPERRPDPSNLSLDASSATQLVHRFSSAPTREEKCHASQ